MVKADTEYNKLSGFPAIAEYLFPPSISLPASMSAIQNEITTPKCIEVGVHTTPCGGVLTTPSCFVTLLFLFYAIVGLEN